MNTDPAAWAMTTARKRQAAKRNLRKPQRGGQGTSSRARAQPAGRGRAKPGARSGDRFYRIEVAPARRFIAFRYHDVGKRGVSSASRVNAQTALGTQPGG